MIPLAKVPGPKSMSQGLDLQVSANGGKAIMERSAGTYSYKTLYIIKSACITSGRSDHYGELYDNGQKLLIFGGRSVSSDPSIPEITYADVWNFDFNTHIWTELVPTSKDKPIARFAHAGAMVGSSTLYIFGGITLLAHGSISVLSGVWSFSLTTKAWQQERLEIEFLRSFHTLNVVHGQFYTFGGYVVYSNPSAAFVYNDLMVS